jgi:hypothetical protein
MQGGKAQEAAHCTATVWTSQLGGAVVGERCVKKQDTQFKSERLGGGQTEAGRALELNLEPDLVEAGGDEGGLWSKVGA